MIFGFDCGNSFIKIYIFSDSGHRDTITIASSLIKLNSFLNQMKEIPEKIIISSVVSKLSIFLNNYYKDNAIVKFSVSKETTTAFKVNYSSQAGADRLLNCYSALKLFENQDVIVIDAGTAVNFDIFLKEKSFDGGIIIPGMMTAVKSLNLSTSLLPEIKVGNKYNLVGKDSESCIGSGILNGWPIMIQNLTNEIEDKYNRKFVKVLTGGSSNILKNSKYLADFEFVNNFQLNGFEFIADIF